MRQNNRSKYSEILDNMVFEKAGISSESGDL